MEKVYKNKHKTDSDLQSIIEKAANNWDIKANMCRSAYFINYPESKLDELLDEKQKK